MRAGGVVVQPHKIAEANATENLWRHRVAVLEDIDADDVDELAFLAGVIRHEIEHAMQRTIGREAFGLYEVVDQVVRFVAAGDTPRYRELINASPIEADANAAAAAFVRSRHPQAVAALLAGPDKYLVAPTGAPGDATTLCRAYCRFPLAVPLTSATTRSACPKAARSPTSSTTASPAATLAAARANSKARPPTAG